MTDGSRAGEELARVIAAQHPDGSWGQHPSASRRIVPTIFTARSLQESRVDAGSALDRALGFLEAAAVVDGGASIDGTRDSVLSCYTGILANLLVRAGRFESARPLLEWIVRYQPVVFGGTAYLQPAPPVWGEYLRHRYGGCMADSTTCLLGLVPSMGALVAGQRAGLEVAAATHLDAIRQLLTDRRVMFGRAGAVLPLAGRTRKDPAGTRWLAPAFPLDYVIDLVELVQLAVDVGVPADAMSEAVRLIESWQLPGGGWPMLGTRRIPDAYRPERVDRRRASPIISRRVAGLGLFPGPSDLPGR